MALKQFKDQRMADAALSLFADYRKATSSPSRRVSTDEELDEISAWVSAHHSPTGRSGPQPVGNVMREGELRAILCNETDNGVDQELFDVIWKIFDYDDSGFVRADEFVMAMALISNAHGTVEAQLEATFAMFDTEHNGHLSRSEFEKMIQATVNISLFDLLDSANGAAAFEAQLQREFSSENLNFWVAVKDYRTVESGAQRLLRAKQIMHEFIDDEADQQVNLPSKIMTALREAVDGCDEQAPDDIFDDAADEIFKLMEKDTYRRFKHDENAIASLVAKCYQAAGLQEGTDMTYDAFRVWALNEPAVLTVFTKLSEHITGLIQQRADGLSFQRTTNKKTGSRESDVFGVRRVTLNV